ncbi:baseplate tail-tube junction protein [Vibrio parahaemolyticus]|uniref:baseplate tail-tube junction protein n=1 Tax=Vibrio parahaemolyticus TaxID=670 RepID=UPI0009F1466A|nr:baseplate tail-tube junction protein [Vibrio parahaemolyticus]EIQ1511476.1 baseplate tail-tube junction protein [Vibrio parahaemolyticus]EJT1883326.1 baseplate tail-tube junction protein [Vibrio parahaemolyticus]ELB2772476.1 baseplate tail-tube junction protein [Vibrio parahaemolyticus]OQU03694.1 hypothetical protein EN00_011065 [Vibrio parahaemolyticus]
MDNYIGGDLADSINSLATDLGSINNSSIESDLGTPQSGSITEQTVLSYPSDFTGHSNFLVARAVDITGGVTRAYYGDMRQGFTSNNNRNTLTSASGREETIAATICLAMPLLQDSLVHDIGGSVDDITSVALAAGLDVADLEGDLSKLSSGVKSLVQNAKDITVGTVSQQAGQGSRQSTLASGNKVIQNNPGTDSWQGTQLREQTLIWQFNPKSLPELKAVASIIKTFKLLSLGSIGNSSNELTQANNNDRLNNPYGHIASYIKTPPLWFLEEVSDYYTGQDGAGARYTDRLVFGPAAIASIKVNRTPDQYWKTFKGTAGDPASLDLEITFIELLPLDKETVQRDFNSSVAGTRYN